MTDQAVVNMISRITQQCKDLRTVTPNQLLKLNYRYMSKKQLTQILSGLQTMEVIEITQTPTIVWKENKP